MSELSILVVIISLLAIRAMIQQARENKRAMQAQNQANDFKARQSLIPLYELKETEYFVNLLRAEIISANEFVTLDDIRNTVN